MAKELDDSDLRIREIVDTDEHAVQAMRDNRTVSAINGFHSLVPKAKRISSLDELYVPSAALHQVSHLSDGGMKADDTAAAETMLASLTPGSEPIWMLQFALTSPCGQPSRKWPSCNVSAWAAFSLMVCRPLGLAAASPKRCEGACGYSAVSIIR